MTNSSTSSPQTSVKDFPAFCAALCNMARTTIEIYSWVLLPQPHLNEISYTYVLSTPTEVHSIQWLYSLGDLSVLHSSCYRLLQQ